jgi:hypothetical protein
MTCLVKSWCWLVTWYMYCDREFFTVRHCARLLLILGSPGFARLLELPLRSQFVPATLGPSQVELLLHRFGSWSKMVYVSRRNVAIRPKTAPRELLDSLTHLLQRLAACRVFFSLDMVGCQHFEMEV